MLNIPIWGLKVSSVKFLRLGKPGAEIPAIIDRNGKFRNLSPHLKDLNSKTINFETIEKLKKINFEQLEEIDQNERIGLSNVIGFRNGNKTIIIIFIFFQNIF